MSWTWVLAGAGVLGDLDYLQVWSFADGKYSPLVAGPERVYLVGYTKMYGLVTS